MIRVLFVDDEPAVLEGLQNRLRPLRKRWTTKFVHGGEEALAALREEPFDVLVCDMRMPGIDGTELFKRVREEHPNTVRVVLSGQLSQEELLRALPLSHQILTKPCEPALLESTVEKACALMALLDKEQLKSTIASMQRLPALPRIYWQLTAKLEDPESSLADVAKVIEQDMAITARVLQLVNSAYYGSGRPQTSVQKAVTTLGLRAIQGVLMAFELLQSAGATQFAHGFSIDVVQRHSFRTASVAAALLEDPEESRIAYSAAMLHQIGTVVMATRLKDDFARASAYALEHNVPSYRAEQEVLGYTHAEAGAQLLALWGLPYPLIAAVANHHEPLRGGEERFGPVGAVHVADVLVHRADGAGRNAAPDAVLEVDMEYLASVGAVDALPRWRETADRILRELEAKEER